MAHTGHQNAREPMFGSYLMHIFRARADVGEPMLHYFGPRADIGADVAQFPAASRCWAPMLYILRVLGEPMLHNFRARANIKLYSCLGPRADVAEPCTGAYDWLRVGGAAGSAVPAIDLHIRALWWSNCSVEGHAVFYA